MLPLLPDTCNATNEDSRADADGTKFYYKPVHSLVNDPTSSLFEGDIIRLAPERHSKHVKHTVAEILAPFSKPVTERPPLLSQEQREAMRDEKRRAKVERRALRGVSSAVEEAKRRGWGVGQVYAEANREGHNVERERTAEHGRVVVPGGEHLFGGIHEEAREGSKRALRRMERGKEHEREREEVAEKTTEEVARQKLSVR